MKKRTILRSLGLIVAFFTASVVPSQANTYTWTNTSGGNWNNANNWSPNQVPSTNDTAVITVAGTYSVTLDVSPTVAGLDLGASAGATTQGLVWAGFTLTVNGPIQVGSNGQFNLSSGALAGTNVLTGTLTWSGGSISGVLTVATNSVVDIVNGGDSIYMDGLVLTNYGTVNWTNSTIFSQAPGNAQIYNYGLWNAQSDNTFQGGYSGGSTLIDNFGTFVKSGNTGATVLDGNVVFNNTGMVNVQTGTLDVNGGGRSSGGNLTTSGAGILNFSSYGFTNTNTFTGIGSFVAAGATFGGTIVGTLSWDGGSVSGVLTVATNSVLDIVNGGDSIYMDGLALTNYGTVNWANSTIYSQGPGNAQIYNYGLWNAQSDNTFQGGYSGGSTLFDNFGTFLKSGNTGTTTLDSGVVFNNTGTVNVQTGTLDIGGGTSSGGDFTTASGAFLNFIDTVYDFANTTTFTGIGSFVAAGATFGGTIVGTLSWDGGNVSGVLTVATNGVLDIVTGGGNNIDGLVLTNYGTVNWTNSTIFSQGPGNAQIYNYGLWNAQSDNSFYGGYGGGSTLFDNFGTFVKSGNTGTTTLDSGVVFNNTGTVNGDSGTLAVEGGGINSGSGTFTTTNGGLLVLDDITFANSVTISSSTVVYLGGNTSVNGVLTAPELQLVSGTLSGTNVLTGTLTWSGGSISGVLTVATNSVLDIVNGGDSIYMDGLVLTNYGTVNWTNSTIFSQAPGNAQIYNYGLWNAQSDNNFYGGNGGGSTLFDNFGTFLKSGNTGATVLDGNVVFNNTGMVTVESGTLDVSGGGRSSGGNLTTSGAGILNFSSYSFTNTNTFTGIGSFVAAGATFGGTIVGTLSWDGGSVSGVLTVATNSVLDIVNGGDSIYMDGLALTNYGTVNWTNSTIFSQGPGNAQIYNYGLWNAQSDNSFYGGNGGGSTLFDNFGTFVKSGNAGATTLDSGVVFNNTGTVNVQTGTLDIGGGTSSGGDFTTTSGAFLNFIDTVYDFTNTNTFAGIGSFVASGATFGGTIVGTLSWDGGSVSGVLTVATNSVLDIVTGGGNNIDGLVLTNYGTINWTNSTIYSQGPGNAQIYNYGLWNAQSDKTFYGGNGGGSTLFDNFGTFVKSGNTGATVLDGNVVFNNTGTVQASSGTMSFGGAFVQNTGQTVLNGGNFTFSQVAQLLGGTLTGTGVITGSVSNNAAIGTGASPGLLAISGNYTEGANAHLAIKLGGTSAGATYDQLFVGGNASLAGSLDLSYWNGFTPSGTNVFTVLACGALTGAFSALTSPGNGLDALYGATDVLVVLHHPPPTVQLTVPAQALAGHTFAVAGFGTCLEGTVTNFALLLGTNVLLSAPGSSASVNYSSDFPGNLTFTAVAMVNTGTQGQTNATVTITTLPLRTLDGIGFQANLGFKLLMLGAAGTDYQVQASTNLAVTNWTILGTMENTNGIWRYFDTTATNSPERFYRAEQLP